MITDKQLADGFAALWQSSSDLALQIARLGVYDSSGNMVYDVVGRPSYKHVRLGANGELGPTIALNRIGVSDLENQVVRLRRENGQFVIVEAEVLAAGSGGGGGADALGDLSDVTINAPGNGQFLVFNGSQWVNTTGGAGLAAHTLDGAFHTGTLAWIKVSKSGSSISDLADHSHDSLSDITPDQHHPWQHPIIAAHPTLGTAHTVVGSAFQVVGLPAANTLGLLTPSSNPGANAALLRTDANGSFQFDTDLWVIDAVGNDVYARGNTLRIDADNKVVGINVVPAGAGLDVRSPSPSVISQRIKQISGQTGRLWRVERADGQELIVMDSQGNLQSGNPGFVSGWTGWQITHDGVAEFEDAWIRGELHATVFVVNEIHAAGGTMLVASAGKLHSDWYYTSTPVTGEMQLEYSGGFNDWDLEYGGSLYPLEVSVVGNYLEVEDPPSGPGFLFHYGDTVRAQTRVETGVSGAWFQIVSRVQMSGYSRYLVNRVKGSATKLPKGTAIVSYGQEGDGRILLTSDLNYAPYIDVVTVGAQPWNFDENANASTWGQSIVPRVRLGRLDGVGVPFTSGIEQYGLIAGLNLADANSPYIVASNLGVRLFKTDMRLHDGNYLTGWWAADGNLYAGSNVEQTATTSLRVVATGIDAGDVIIGNQTRDKNYVWWDQSAGALHVNGDLIVGDGPQYATIQYVDGADVVVLSQASSDATSKANQAEIDAINAAASDATTKANQAESDAITAAAGDATTKANQAQSNAITTAAGDATTKANQARTDANNYTDGRESAIRDDLGIDIDQAQADAQLYGAARRVLAVGGTWTVTSRTSLTWSDVPLQIANGVPRTINQGSLSGFTQRTYLYVTLTGTGNVNMKNSPALASLGTDDALIAVVDPGTVLTSDPDTSGSNRASISIVGGSTYISGDNIVTGSINTKMLAATAVTADKIAAEAVTAAKIYGTELSAVKTLTGALTVNDALTLGGIGAPGRLLGGKSGYSDSNPGIFIGYDSSGGINAYKMHIGNSSYSLSWTGNSLSLRTNVGLEVYVPSGLGDLLRLESQGNGIVGSPQYQAILRPMGATTELPDTISVVGDPWYFNTSYLYVNRLDMLADTLRIRVKRKPAPYYAAGYEGEICWDKGPSDATPYLYLNDGSRWWRLPFSQEGWT